MKESALTSSNRLGGAVISDRIVASLLEELRTCLLYTSDAADD